MKNNYQPESISVTPAEYASWEERTLTVITNCILALLERGKITPDQAEEYLKEAMK
jgi:hypothetical protein